MIKLSLQNTWAHKRRLFGTFMAVLIGVGFLSGTLILGDTLRANFTKLFDAGFAGVDVVVRPVQPDDEGGDGGGSGVSSLTVPAELVDEIDSIDGVRATVAETETFGQLLDSDGERIGGNGPPTFAARWNPDKGINPYRLIEGDVPVGPNEVIIDKQSAEDGKLTIGDTTGLLLPDRIEVDIVGIAQFGDGTAAVGVTYAFFSDSGTVEHLTRSPGTANRIVVAGEDGLTQVELRNRIETVVDTYNGGLGDDVAAPGAAEASSIEAVTGEVAADEAVDDLNADFLSFLTGFLVAFAGIAVFVATFSIYNTFSIIVAQRSRESALMRAIGATRGQVMTATMVEAVVIGVAASAVGFVAGLGFASGLKALFDAFGLGLPAGGLTIKATSIVVGLVVGIVVTLVAAVVPARRGSRVAPIEALRASAVEAEVPKARRGIAGIVLTLIGIAVMIYAVTVHPDLEIETAGIGAAVTLIGVLVLGPVIARPVAGLIGLPLAKIGGITGELSRENATRNPRRTASTAAALLVGVAIVVLFSVFISSAKNLVTQTVDRTFGGDLVVTFGGFGGVLPPTLAADAAELPGVQTAVGLGFGDMNVNGTSDFTPLADVEALSGLLDLGIVEGTAGAVVDGTIAISDVYAKDENLGLGDTVPGRYPDGVEEDMEVTMIYTNSDIVGGYLLPRSGYTPHSNLVADFLLFVSAEDGASVTDVRGELKDLVADIGKPDVQDRSEYAESVGAQLNLFLGLVIVMLALAIIIAVMGIANTLALSVYERTREIGVLRAVGTTRRQVRRLVRWESVIVSTFGTVGGVGLGVGLGWVLVQAAFADSEENPFAIPVSILFGILIAGIVVGALAAALPAYRAAKMEVLSAVSAS